MSLMDPEHNRPGLIVTTDNLQSKFVCSRFEHGLVVTINRQEDSLVGIIQHHQRSAGDTDTNIQPRIPLEEDGVEVEPSGAMHPTSNTATKGIRNKNSFFI